MDELPLTHFTIILIFYVFVLIIPRRKKKVSSSELLPRKLRKSSLGLFTCLFATSASCCIHIFHYPTQKQDHILASQFQACCLIASVWVAIAPDSPTFISKYRNKTVFSICLSYALGQLLFQTMSFA